LPLIDADASQLQQLIMNLTINAAESVAPEKHGTVSIATALRHECGDDLRVTPGQGAPAGVYVALEVRDTGAGMEEATVARIFDPFFTTKFTGRDLGLAAVQGIVRGHKGLLKIESVPGKGTTFKVLFPPLDQPLPTKPQLRQWRGRHARGFL
jgi:signal transduction histidine kinase